ncbi:MAG: tetratricopeptide repeat protein [bacterium]
MQTDLEDLIRKAVKAAIALDWPSARDYNVQLLELDPENTDAKVRLGKAYLELGDYAKAKKLFKEALQVDPINPAAKKNLNLAKEGKRPSVGNGGLTNIIQEPATFVQTPAEITAKNFTASKLPMGASLDIKVFSQTAKLYYQHKNQKIELGVITEPKIVKRLKTGKEEGAIFSGTFVKGSDKDIVVLINSSLPIFEAERQELKPYTKRDFSDVDPDPEPILEEN